MTNRLLTFTESAAIAGVSKTTIRKWVDGGYLPAVSLPASSRRRVRERVLLGFLDSLEEQTEDSTKFGSSKNHK